MGDNLELLTVEEVAELLQCHPDSVRRMMRQGRLPAVKGGWGGGGRGGGSLAMTGEVAPRRQEGGAARTGDSPGGGRVVSDHARRE
ncbi:helix-turn-helix domain-containing protein [Candidatus Amarolinea dominans]|uniref:helix-turn-helix domain-containing protein n=1 Tax=Candidatus Amarolinea dominans TaxID=3140696 RepID=UPI003136C875|nr:helix-turn-helix domain-containing protein [Anaerolineae bacterium]